MAATPQRLDTSEEEGRQGDAAPETDLLKTDVASEDRVAQIPIFCAGGCGEVMGFFKKGQSVPAYRCAACRAAETVQPPLASPTAVPASTDELAELRSPPRDLRLIHILQVLAVVLIFAGSVCIAMGRPLGIYLATVGTLVWVAVATVRWRMKN